MPPPIRPPPPSRLLLYLGSHSSQLLRILHAVVDPIAIEVGIVTFCWRVRV